MISSCCFIRDSIRGAFCVFESMASLLPFVDEMVVMDLGSEDGTLEALREISNHNNKVKLVSGSFTFVDANVFATLANDLVAMCQYDNVLYWQADEIWHEDLLKLMAQRFERGEYDLSFWRIQFRDNFQKVKWFPHLVHRVGLKGSFEFNGDGMNTTRTWDARICSNYGGEMFPQWGSMQPLQLPVNEMITDVSLVGGFRDNIPDRRRMHAPFWHEEPHIEGLPAHVWHSQAIQNPDWTKADSPFGLPQILRYHVGKTKYELRPELLEALKWDKTREFIGL